MMVPAWTSSVVRNVREAADALLQTGPHLLKLLQLEDVVDEQSARGVDQP